MPLHLVFSPLEFLEELAALVSPPRAHLTRFHGVLAPHSKIRSKVVPKEEPKPEGEPAAPKKARMSWAKLLNMENCERCGGKKELLAAIMETEAIEKILKHLGRPHKPPEFAVPPTFSQTPSATRIWLGRQGEACPALPTRSAIAAKASTACRELRNEIPALLFSR